MNYSIIANNKIKDKVILYGIRRDMVEYYHFCRSYRKTASYFGVNVKTIIKWVRRYKKEGLEGFKDLLRKPKMVHNKVRNEVEELVVKLREQSHFGAKRLKMEFELPISYTRYKLPRYQITARNVRTGVLYYFYTYEKSVLATTMCMKRLLNHLFRYGIKPENITIQTDNGFEFSGIRMYHNRGFKKYLEKELKVRHRYIPPRCPNANADVETSHKIIEKEFYSIEHITSKKDFLEKSTTYQYYFNLMRKNSYKEWKTPVDILKEYNILPNIALLPPVIIDELYENIGQNDDSNLYSQVYHHDPEHPGNLIVVLRMEKVVEVNLGKQ